MAKFPFCFTMYQQLRKKHVFNIFPLWSEIWIFRRGPGLLCVTRQTLFFWRSGMSIPLKKCQLVAYMRLTEGGWLNVALWQLTHCISFQGETIVSQCFKASIIHFVEGSICLDAHYSGPQRLTGYFYCTKHEQLTVLKVQETDLRV